MIHRNITSSLKTMNTHNNQSSMSSFFKYFYRLQLSFVRNVQDNFEAFINIKKNFEIHIIARI